MSIDSIKRNIIFFSVIGITLIGVFSYNSYHKMTFQRDAEQLTENSLKLSVISYKMCESSSDILHYYDLGFQYFDVHTGKMYFDNTGNRANNLVYCSSVNELKLQLGQFFISTGIVDLMDKYKNNMEIAFKRLESAQGKYKNEFNDLDEVYRCSSQLYDDATTSNGENLVGDVIRTKDAFYYLNYEMCPIFEKNAKEYQFSANSEFFKKTGIDCPNFDVFSLF